MSHPLVKAACLAALSSIILTGCGAPKPPMPSGERVAINGQPLERQEDDRHFNDLEQYPNLESQQQRRGEGRR